MKPYLYIAKIRVLMALAYRSEVYAAVFSRFVMLLTAVYLWKASYKGIDAVEGVHEAQMMTFAVISTLLGIFLSTGVQNTINDRVREGLIATDLLRPVHPLGIWFAEDIGSSMARIVIEGLPLFLLSMLILRPPLPTGPAAFSFFLLSTILGFCIVWLMSATVAMVAFWVMELGNLHNVLHVGIRILSGSLVPVWFFPESVQRICNLLPFVYIYQGPLGIYIGKTTGRAVAHTLALQAVWAVLLFALLSLVWRRVQSRVMIQGG